MPFSFQLLVQIIRFNLSGFSFYLFHWFRLRNCITGPFDAIMSQHPIDACLTDLINPSHGDVTLFRQIVPKIFVGTILAFCNEFEMVIAVVIVSSLMMSLDGNQARSFLHIQLLSTTTCIFFTFKRVGKKSLQLLTIN